MKVLFLDHDGVICLQSEWGSRSKKQIKVKRKLSQDIMTLPVDARFDNFNKKAVKVLNELIEETDLEIVVSSDWRSWATVGEMGDYYLSQGILKRPLDYTTTILDTNFDFDPKFELQQTRSLEILEWLDIHAGVSHWVAVDDLDMSNLDRNWGLSNFVHTTKPNEGIKKLGVKEKILQFLK